jgi:hypothetical protein
MPEKKFKGRILILGSFSESFMSVLKAAVTDFEIDKLVLTDCSLDYFFNFVTDQFRPDIILIHPEDYLIAPDFYEALKFKHFPKVYIFMLQKMKLNLFEEFSKDSVELMKQEMEKIIVVAEYERTHK